MACDSRQLTQSQLEAGFQNQRTGVQKAIRPFSGEATPESLADYLNKEVFPVLQQARAKLNEVFLQVVDNAPSGNPLAFYFSDETADADPTAGRIRLDAATQNTATTMRVSQENGRLVDVAPWLDVMAGGATSPLGTVTLFDVINPGRFIRWDLDTMTDQGAYWDLGVTVIESSHDNPFVDGEGVVISFIPGVSAAGSTVPVTSLGDLAGLSVLGRAANSTGAMAAITATAADQVARVNAAGTSLEWGQCTTGSYADDSVTAAKLFDVNPRAILCKATAGAGDVEMLNINSNSILVRNGTGDLASLTLGGNCVVGRLGSGNPTIISSSATNQILLRGSGSILFAQINDDEVLGRVGAGVLASSKIVTNMITDANVTLPKIATQAAGTVLANVTAGVASPTAHALSTLAGSGLTYTNVTGVMDVDDVALTALADQADDTFLANISGGAAPPTAVALTTLAGAGLTGGANAVLAVGAGDGIDVNADDVAVDVTDIIDNVTITEVATNNIQRAALTGFAAASAGSNATTSAEPIVTYSASANMSAERVTTSSTSITVSTSVASQIEFQRAALTGDVTASANSNATTIANDAVTNAKAANMASLTFKSNLTSATADPADNTADDALEVLLRDGRVKVFSEDFFSLGQSYLSGNEAVGFWHWSNINSDDGVFRGIVSEANHPGIAQLDMTAAPGTLSANAASTDDIGIIDMADVAFLRFVVRIANVSGAGELTDTTYGIGLIQDSADAELGGNSPNLGGNGLVLVKTPATANWIIRRESASAASTLTSSEAGAISEWVECVLINNGSGSWSVTLNGVAEGNITGVPTSGLVFPSFWISSTGAGEKNFDADLFEIGVRFSGNRYT